MSAHIITCEPLLTDAETAALDAYCREHAEDMRKEVRRVTEDRLFYPVDPGFVLNRGNVLEAG